MEFGINEYWMYLYGGSSACVGFGFYLALERIKDLKKLYQLEKAKSQESKPVSLKDTLHDLTETEKYLETKLDNLFQSFIYKNILYTLKQYSTTLSEETKRKLRVEFIEYVEFHTTEKEKEIFRSRFENFSRFKFIVLNFFNIKLTKLELFICHKMIIDEKEFKDYKLFESIFNQLSRKDIDNIMDMFQDGTKADQKINDKEII